MFSKIIIFRTKSHFFYFSVIKYAFFASFPKIKTFKSFLLSVLVCSKQELQCSKKRRMSTFLKHLKIIFHFLLICELINESMNESSVSRTAPPPLKIILYFLSNVNPYSTLQSLSKISLFIVYWRLILNILLKICISICSKIWSSDLWLFYLNI